MMQYKMQLELYTQNKFQISNIKYQIHRKQLLSPTGESNRLQIFDGLDGPDILFVRLSHRKTSTRKR